MTDATEVKLHFLDYWRIVKMRSGLIALVFLLVMVTAGVTTYFLPRQYFSKATLEVKPDNFRAIGDIFGPSGRAGLDPQFVSTQFQILRQSKILDPVIERLELTKKWASEGRDMPIQMARNKLERMLELREVRNTSLIEIGVYSTDAKDARDIANTIARVYSDERLATLNDNVQRGLEQLRDEVEKLRKEVQAAGTEADKIRLRDSIIDPNPESFNDSVSPADRNVDELQRQISEQKLRVTQFESQFEQIMKMKPEDLKDVLRILGIEDQTVVKMVASLQDATTKEEGLLAAGLGERHPTILELRSQKEYFQRTLADQLNTQRANHAQKLETEKRTLARLEENYAAAKQNHIQDKERVKQYNEAKSRYLQAKKLYEAAEVKLSTEQVENQVAFIPVTIWGEAEIAVGWSKPNIPAYMSLAALAGLVIGVGLAFFIEYLDTSVKTLEDIERYLQTPVLAVIPKDVAVLIKTRGDTADAEAYRILRTQVEFNKPSRDSNTFTLVSAGPGEGKSTTLNNLAYTCAVGGYNVLVVDADIRRPTQHRFFDQNNNLGLTDYLLNRASIDEIVKTTKIDNLSFIPSGALPEDAVGVLNSQRMVEFIERVKQQYDLVFFDSPPILGVSDGSVLASECDATIMVVQHRRFPRAMLQRVKQAVNSAGGKLIGVVLNNVDRKHDDGYSYGYNDYYATPKRSQPVHRNPAAAAAAPTKEAVVASPRRDGEEY